MHMYYGERPVMTDVLWGVEYHAHVLCTAVFLCDFTPLNNMAAESLDWASMARKFEFSNRQNTSRPWFPLDFGD